MAIIFEEALKKSITSAKIYPVYIILGDDGFLKKSYVEKISQKITDKDDIFNLQKFGPECDLQEVYDSLSQLPVMAEKKCVILCDYDFEHCSKTELDKLYSLALDTSDSAVLIIWFDNIEIDIKKSSKFKKLVTAAEKGGGVAVQLNHRKMPELIKMLTDGALKRGCKMDSAAARYLVETAGEDINTLKNELEKLCCYLPNGNITKNTVDLVCIKTVEASVYNLAKHITDCDIPSAVNLLDELFFMRIEPVIILYTISSVYIDMYRVSVAKRTGKTIADIAAMFGYKGREFVLERSARNLSKFDSNKINLSFNALLDADRQLKSFNSNAKIVLEQLIVRLVYIISRGEAVD